MVISYIYLTRIVVVLLVPIIPYQISWLRVVLDEVVTFIFYVIIGYCSYFSKSKWIKIHFTNHSSQWFVCLFVCLFVCSYWFRPVEDNPYFKAESDEEEVQLHEIETSQ
jgi:hypothetical protein